MEWHEWLKVNWSWIVTAAVLTASVLNLLTSHFGEDHPWLKKLGLFLVDLLAILVSRGCTDGPGRPGGLYRLKLPIVQWSPEPKSRVALKTRAGSVISRVGIILAVLLMGCAGWKANTLMGIDGVTALAAYAPGAILLRCEVAKDACIAAKDRVCEPLQVCGEDAKKAAKANVLIQGVALGGIAAVKVGDKPKAELALAEALGLIGPVRTVLKAYGVTVP